MTQAKNDVVDILENANEKWLPVDKLKAQLNAHYYKVFCGCIEAVLNDEEKSLPANFERFFDQTDYKLKQSIAKALGVGGSR